MSRRWVVAFAVACVLANIAAFWFLRQRMSAPPAESSSPSAPVAPSSAEPAEAANPIQGPVFLAGAESGDVLRTTRGDCDDAVPAVAWVAPAGAGPAEVEVPGLVEVLGIGAAEGGWWVVGTGTDCAVRAWTSRSLEGTRWQDAPPPADAWYLDPLDPSQVYSPRGRQASGLDCRAAFVQAVDGQAFLVCDDGRSFATERGGRRFTQTSDAADVVAVDVRADGRQVQLVQGDACPAGVRLETPKGLVDDQCFNDGRAPLGIAWTGSDLVAQIGYDLVTNAGGEWRVRS